MKELPARFWSLIDDRARRVELLCATLRGGGLAVQEAAKVLQVELADLERDAQRDGIEPLAALAAATRSIVEHIVGLENLADEDRRDILILDDSEVTTDLIALAIEAQGHSVRIATNLDEFVVRFGEREPEIILTELEIEGAPIADLCAHLRVRISNRLIPIIVFSLLSEDALATAALNAGAEHYLSKDQGIADLVDELKGLLKEVLW